MKSFRPILMLAAAVLFACDSRPSAHDIQADVVEALSSDSQIAEAATQRLRSGGPEVFEKLLQYRDEQPSSADLESLNRLIDQVGGARYSSVSGLYWHTDLDQAQAEAKASKKPILSLRMMGRLTDEYSCANSRFFRTTLYANKEISQFLKEHYVLHWKSVRPVPKVTIDFGDGRKLERTLTGNSIHYVLASDGLVIDGLPGLYNPARFLAWLKELEPNAAASGQFAGTQPQRRDGLKSWHAWRAASIARRWRSDLDTVALLEQEQKNAEAQAGNEKNPPAARATLRAMPKAILEMPILQNIVRDSRALELETDRETWDKIANRHLEGVKLDQASIDLIRAENPVINGGETPAGDEALGRLVAAFEKAIAQDTVRNEYLLHSKLHEWFANGTAPEDLEKLNEKVYAELFLTPREDPWIGLVPPDTYTGLTNAGVVSPK